MTRAMKYTAQLSGGTILAIVWWSAIGGALLMQGAMWLCGWGPRE